MKIITFITITLTLTSVFTKEKSANNKNENNSNNKQISVVDRFPDIPVVGSVINNGDTLHQEAVILIFYFRDSKML